LAKEPRNPFKLRAAEPVVSETTFLRLFGAKPLDMIPHDNWDRVQLFQGAPGCGKTSLFRVFTPSALLALYRHRNDDEYKELYKRMDVLEILNDSGPDVLGVLLSGEATYALLEDLDGIEQKKREILFFSLLNARIILSTLRGACALKHLNYPNDLAQLSIERPIHASIPEWLTSRFPCSGQDLYQWMVKIEEDICSAIGSYNPSIRADMFGNDSLFSLALIRADAIQHLGKPIASRVLIMLDNAHKLAENQRRLLLETLLSERWPVGVWIAERLEALSPNELLARGANLGREYGRPIRLEDYWRGKRALFENTVVNIADKRARFASDFLTTDLHFGSFASYLQSSLDESKWNIKYQEAGRIIERRLKENFEKNPKYSDLLQVSLNSDSDPQKRVIDLRATEIFLEREVGKKQLPLFPLSPEELDRADKSDIQAAAELFISQEFDIPYYYGTSVIAALASSNIEQFLSIAGELFEHIISARLLNREVNIPPEKQQTIIKRHLKTYWESIPRRVPQGDKAQRLLYSIQQFARAETYRPNAPYTPGVTGIALTMSERDLLSNPNTFSIHPEYRDLALILSGCIAENLLEPAIISQGQKGEQKFVLYLNRWLCCHADLPLQYGKWRQISISRLYKWLQYGFRLSGEQDNLF
jgi:hypothetical protein